MRALLVLNQRSRRGAREGAAVCKRLAESGIECDVARGARDVEAVIAAGGDGTVIYSVPLALERGVPLGVVPLGTFNDLARTLGIGTDTGKACEAIAHGSTRTIDVGRVNGVHFVNEASIGVSTRIARKQTPAAKQRFGLLAVAAAAVHTIRETRPFGVTLRFDGNCEQFRSVQLTIANSGRFGGVIDRPDAAIDDGWLDLYSVEVTNWAQALPLVYKILSRDATSAKGLRTRRAQQFLVQTAHAHHISADGEPAGMTPALFQVLPGALRVFVP
ncbi:MAG: YegS/Rv2252/BmrU family lipid kinase [Candidatus Baltobacteraceae bacterium]